MTSVFQILLLVISVARFMIFTHFIMSWLINFQVLNIRQAFVSQVWYGLERLLAPIYEPLRRVLPTPGGLDLTPLAALLALEALRIIIVNNMYAF